MIYVIIEIKQNFGLKRHKANIHEIGVTWYNCDLCDYRSKEKSKLKRHKSHKHDLLSNDLLFLVILEKEKFNNGNISNKRKRINKYDFSDGSIEKYSGIYISCGITVSI